MTNSRNSNDGVNPSTNNSSQPRLRHIGITLGALLIVGGVAGVGLRIFVDRRLVPLVERSLNTLLQRPVEIGDVEHFSPVDIRFGPSSVPPTPTDSDSVVMEAIHARFNPLEVLWSRQLTLYVTIVRPQVRINQDADGQWLQTRIQEPEPGWVEFKLDTIWLEDGRVELAPYSSASPTAEEGGIDEGNSVSALPSVVVIEPFDGEVALRNDNRLARFELTGETGDNGQFEVSGEADWEMALEAQAIAQFSQLSLAQLGGLASFLPIRLQDGQVGGNVDVEFRGDRTFDLRGVAQLKDVAAEINGVPNRFTNGQGRLRFVGERVELEDTTIRYGNISVAATGGVNLQTGYDIAARVDSVTAAQLLDTFDFDLPVPVEGAFEADLELTGLLNQPQLTGVATNLNPIQVDRLTVNETRTQFSLTPQALVVDSLTASLVSGGQITGDGRAQFGAGGGLVFDLEARNLNGDAIARQYRSIPPGYTLGALAANVQVFGPFDNIQALVQWQAPGATYAGQGELLFAGDTVSLRNTRLQVAGGEVSAVGQASLSEGRWQALVNAADIQLSQFSDQLTGLAEGEFRLSGQFDDLNPQAINAEGRVTLSQAPYLNQPLTAQLRWLGDRLQVEQASAAGLTASGTIGTRLEGAGAPAITTLDLDVQLRDYDLANVATLPITIPPQVDLAGQVDFTGQVTGTLVDPSIVGTVGLTDLAVNTLAFEPQLTGNLRFVRSRGLTLDVAGEQDQIRVALDASLRPLTFYVQQNDTIAQGQRQGDRLMAQVENFPLETLNLRPATDYGLGELGGLVNGNFDINIADLANPSGLGAVAIARPRIGYITGESFQGRLQFADGIVTLSDGELLLGTSRYSVVGSLNPTGEVPFRGQVITEEGSAQALLVALRIFELDDFTRFLTAPIYGTASDVEPLPVETDDNSVLNQLRRYSEIATLLERQIAERESASIFPSLAELDGQFSGEIDVELSRQDGLSATFDLQGHDWSWGDYDDPNQIVLQGSLDDGRLTFLPFRFESGNTLISFSGTVGGEEENSGQLLAENVSVALLRDLLEVPIDIEGNINANAILTGTVGNPRARGEIILADATINDNPIAVADGFFSYTDARLNFFGRVLVEDEPEEDADPLRLRGSIPYRFPFMTVSPESDAISVNVQLQDEGLALLNLLNQPVTWEGGQGSVRLDVDGTLRQTPSGLDLRPLATGEAIFENARFGAQVLPEPLTNVNGRVLFDRDRIIVENLEGQFSRGQVVAAGVLPILAPLQTEDPDVVRPLTITLSGLTLNLKGLYNGGINGAIALTGTALAPRIGGDIILSNGRVSLPDTTDVQTISTTSATAFPEFGGIVAPPQFDDLQITLGDRLLLTRAPLLNFVATGDLFINGTLDDIRPQGTIRLRSGQVSIFTSQFNLNRRHRNIAEFRPNQGLDPILDVRLITSVLEETRSPISSGSPFALSEVADVSPNDFGELQTIRVEASVVGPASELFNNIELRSSPPRSQNELIALLGGGFVDTLGRGDSALAIANLAGSALFTGIQTLLSNTLGISDFRLFPTTILEDDREGSGSDRTGATLALAAELGFDLTDNLSVSILQLLTVQEETQFNVRYRLNDQFLIRGSTNFSDENRAVLEYEIRF
jgi:translocation and assembly module TamB